MNVDVNDTPYIAFAKHFKCKLWTGDKKLIRGLSKKGFTSFITTDELLHLKNKKKK
jgi:predicted nucleic acid-binding protein